jgi:ubiquitin-activating enzyme E1
MQGNKRKQDEAPSSELPKKAKMDGQSEAAGGVELDENLHSRQLAVYGREVMRRMAGAAVLVAGANGTGVEIGEAWRGAGGLGWCPGGWIRPLG